MIYYYYMKNKGGQLPKEKRFILDQRLTIMSELLKVFEWSQSDVAKLFNIDRSQITRAVKNKKLKR